MIPVSRSTQVPNILQTKANQWLTKLKAIKANPNATKALKSISG